MKGESGCQHCSHRSVKGLLHPGINTLQAVIFVAKPCVEDLLCGSHAVYLNSQWHWNSHKVCLYFSVSIFFCLIELLIPLGHLHCMRFPWFCLLTFPRVEPFFLHKTESKEKHASHLSHLTCNYQTLLLPYSIMHNTHTHARMSWHFHVGGFVPFLSCYVLCVTV